MTKQLKYLTLLISLSLISILCLQGYFLYTDYQSKKVDFEDDLNAMLEVTTTEMNLIRNQEIHRLIRKDVLDTNYVKLEYDLDREEGPELKVINKKTGQTELSLTVSRDGVPKGSANMETYLLNRYVAPVYNEGKGSHGFLYMTTLLTDRLTLYRDTVSVDMELFESKLLERMGDRSITPNYQMSIVHQDSVFVIHTSNAIVSKPFKLDHQGRKNDVIVYFEAPFLNILQRSYLLLVASVVVLVLVTISFSFLMKTINKQRKLSQLKDDFIDGVTHELLTPIATMKIALETLGIPQIMEDKEKSKRYIDISTHELDRISSIVHNVLHTSLHEQNEARFNYEEVNLDKVVRDLMYYHSNRSEKVVEFIYESKESLALNTDKQHITNVIHNLIDNAIKYNTSEPAVVRIDLEQSQSEVSITISDNGPGIAEFHQDRIFEKFYRALDKGNETVNGLGVGLYYVQSTLARLNGSVSLLKSSSEGSDFRVSLKTRTS